MSVLLAKIIVGETMVSLHDGRMLDYQGAISVTKMYDRCTSTHTKNPTNVRAPKKIALLPDGVASAALPGKCTVHISRQELKAVFTETD